jgi:peroxiredoxin
MSLLFSLLLALTPAQASGVPAPSVKVGDPALLFSLPAVNEDAALRAVARPHVALSDYTGVSPGFPAKLVVVEFVKQKGAEAQLATLNRLHKKYVNRGVRFLAIVADDGDLATLSEWVEGQRLEFPVLRDAHHVVVDRYGVKQFPLAMLVDASGDIDALGAPKDDLEAGLEALIQPFLGE